MFFLLPKNSNLKKFVLSAHAHWDDYYIKKKNRKKRK